VIPQFLGSTVKHYGFMLKGLLESGRTQDNLWNAAQMEIEKDKNNETASYIFAADHPAFKPGFLIFFLETQGIKGDDPIPGMGGMPMMDPVKTWGLQLSRRFAVLIYGNNP
jgi:hypothetical protein